MALDSHTVNPLLQKGELGRTTRRGHDLPPESFVYGLPSAGDRDGAAKALGSWTSLEKALSSNALGGPASGPGGLQRSKTMNDRDFVSLNKAATRKGLFTSQDVSKFRATHNTTKPLIGSKQLEREVTRIPPETVFGQPTMPCTPVFDLLEHKYQQKWLQDRRQQDLLSWARSTQSKPSRDVYENRATLLRKYLPPIENHELWQIRKFKKVGPHVSSFRSENARKTALQNQEFDGASRFGYLGQGAYVVT